MGSAPYSLLVRCKCGARMERIAVANHGRELTNACHDLLDDVLPEPLHHLGGGFSFQPLSQVTSNSQVCADELGICDLPNNTRAHSHLNVIGARGQVAGKLVCLRVEW